MASLGCFYWPVWGIFIGLFEDFFHRRDEFGETVSEALCQAKQETDDVRFLDREGGKDAVRKCSLPVGEFVTYGEVFSPRDKSKPFPLSAYRKCLFALMQEAAV